MRDSFTFYRSFMEALDSVDAETYKRLMMAITHYAMDGIMPDNLSGLEKSIFISWKANVDASNKRKDNGKLGGRPPKEESEKPLVIEEETIGFEDENHRLCDEKPNKNKKKNKKENIEVKEEEKQESEDSNNPPIPLAGEWDYSNHSNVDNVEHLLNGECYMIADYLRTHQGLNDCIKNWMEYKDAKKPRSSNHYANAKSIEALLNKFVGNCNTFGERAVIDVVNDSLAAGYQGIIWDKLTKRASPPGKIDWSMV